MKEIFKSNWFAAVFLILTLMIFFLLIVFCGTYQAKTAVLIITKNSATDNSERIIENLKTLPSFIFPETKTEREGKSGIIKIISFNRDPQEAKRSNFSTTREFLSFAAQYYNIKTEIDLRLIGKTSTNYVLSKSILFLAVESLLLGFILASFVFWIFALFFKNGKDFSNNAKIISLKKERLFSYENNNDKEFKISKEKNLFTSFSKKAAAPANLPIAENTFFVEKNFSKKNRLNESERSVEEAAPEEIKERLNKLLKNF